MKTYSERSEAVAEKMKELQQQKKKRSRIIAGTCLALTVVLIGALFIPYDKTPPAMDHYAGHPYYNVIQKISELNYDPPRANNAFESLMQQIGDKMTNSGMGGDAMGFPEADSPDYGAVNGGAEYVEVTDNQVAGVTEADIFKRSDQYLYHLQDDLLSVYSIAGEASACVGTYRIATQGKDEGTDFYYIASAEMYLSADCTTVTAVMQAENKEMGAVTVLYNLDVTDPANITELDHVMFHGSLISTRVAGEDLLLAYNFRVRYNVDYDEPETYVPSYGKPGSMTCVDPEDIICPDTANDTRYTVVCQLDARSLAVEDTKALLGYSTELYVSQNAIYATHSFSEKKQVDANIWSNEAKTRITGIAYGGEKLQYQGSINISGSVNNQYAMDEHQDILRVVTNTSYNSFEELRGEYVTSVDTGATRRNVSLYCIDLKAWKVEALVGGFAPEGERAESVRFDGDTAYVCTAEVITLTDPVYFFDLSDLDNITYTDTGTIDGYSSSLVQLGDGFLMGIGYGDERQLKVEVYEEYQEKVVSVDAWEENVTFSEEYKSYLIDRDNDLVGLAVQNWNSGEYQYLLLHFDGYNLIEVLRVDLGAGDPDSTRACIIDDCIYILNQSGLMVEKVW